MAIEPSFTGMEDAPMFHAHHGPFLQGVQGVLSCPAHHCRL